MVLHLDKKEHRNMQQRSREPSLSLFIPGTKILRPVIDVVSKRLLEQNKEALISLLTAVLSPQSPIEEVTILNPELRNGPSHDDKLSRLDMLVLLNDGQLIKSNFKPAIRFTLCAERCSIFSKWALVNSRLGKTMEGFRT